jgi:hypothetical protein
MAKGQGKGFKTLSAGKNLVKGGPSGGMTSFNAVGAQAPGVTSVKKSGGSKSPGAPMKGGGSGKMHKFDGVRPQKSGITSVK